MKKKILILVTLVSLFNSVCTGQKLLNKLISKVAGASAPEATVVSKLSGLTPTIGFGSNLHPIELETVSQSFFPGWKTGADLIFVMLNSKDNSAFTKIDGTVTIDGKVAEYSTSGVYYIVSDPTNAPRKVELTTSSGEKSSFMLEPNKKQLKVKSINGLTEDIILDLTKNVEIEIDDSKIPENTLLKISIAMSQVGIKSTYDVCYIRKGSKIVIPAAAFRNINIKADGKFKKSFISVGIDEDLQAQSINGTFTHVNYLSTYSDGMFVSVKTEPEINLGLLVKGKDEPTNGTVTYEITKPNAFTSRPFSQIKKKIGISSFVAKGITISATSVITQEKNLEKGEGQTTKTTTITFPKQSNEAWNSLLEKMYPEFTKVLQAEFSASIAEIDAVTKSTSFKKIKSSLPNVNTEKEFSVGIRNTQETNYFSFVESFGINSIQEELFKETGTDALCTFTLELILGEDKGKAFITPKLTYQISGKINGTQTNTTFITGSCLGKGIPSDLIGLEIEFNTTGGKGTNDKKVHSVAGNISAQELEKLMRTSDLIGTFTNSLKEMIAKEKANGDYETVWNLQK